MEVVLQQLVYNLNHKKIIFLFFKYIGQQSYSTEVEVNVKVMDRSMPVFDKQFYSVSVPENIDLYAPIPLSIRADSPLARKLIYSIVAGNTFEEFAIDFNTGEFFIK